MSPDQARQRIAELRAEVARHDELYYRQIGRGGEGFLDVPTYAGVSLEAGDVWSRRSDMSLRDARTHGSVFLGMDTLLGPLYLGTGFGEGGENTFYLFLGRTF